MTNIEHGKLHLGWDFASTTKHLRSRGWYIGASIIGGFSLIFALVTSNFLFAVILIILALILVLQSRQNQARLLCGITEDGVEVGTEFYDYDALKDFWIAYKPPRVKKLYVTFKSTFRPMLIIPLENQNPLRVRKVLLDYLPEDAANEDETTTEALSRLLKI